MRPDTDRISTAIIAWMLAILAIIGIVWALATAG